MSLKKTPNSETIDSETPKHINTQPEDTVCYKCSICCMDATSSCFGAMGRHKMRTFVIIFLPIIFIGCCILNVYSFINSGDYDDRGFVGEMLFFLYLFMGAIESSIVYPAYTKLVNNQDNQEHTSNRDLPIRIIAKYFRLVGSFRPTSNYSLKCLKYYVVTNLMVNHTLMTLTIFILHLTGVPANWYWVLLGFFSMIWLILCGLYYIVYGSYRFLRLIGRECCVKPYYGIKNMRSRDKQNSEMEV
jgi:hypothetical protein